MAKKEDNEKAVNTAEETQEKKEQEKTVRIRLHKDMQNSDDLFVGVNGRTFLIKRGVTVDVPECVAEVIANAEAQRAEAMDYMEQNIKG